MSDLVVRKNIKKLRSIFYENENFLMHKKLGEYTVSTFTKNYIIQKYNIESNNSKNVSKSRKSTQS